MPDLEESNRFDVEARQPLLLPPHSSRLTLQSLFLLIRWVTRFKLSGQNYSSRTRRSSSVSSISKPSSSSIAAADGEDNAGSKIVGVSQDSHDVNSTAQNEHTITIELPRLQRDKILQGLQRDKITEIVRSQNLDELNEYGGVQGVADALNSHLINGRSDDHEAISQSDTSLNLNLNLNLNFFHFFKDGCNNYTIFLLSLAAVLSLSFGIKEEGLSNGWIDGTILIVAIFVLVAFIAIRSYWQARWYKKFQKQLFSEGRNGKVKVIRSREPLVIPSSDLRLGDIVCLQKGYQVPADGIFVAGQGLKLDSGLSSTIDNRNPFLFYGSKVIRGDANARMIVTSVGRDTVWGENMRGKEIGSPEKKCEFEVWLHKLRARVDFVGLILAILILVCMFIRYSLGKRDDEFGYRPDPKGEPTRLKIITDVFKGIIMESKSTARVLIASLSVSLVGIMEGIPFVIAFAFCSLPSEPENTSRKRFRERPTNCC